MKNITLSVATVISTFLFSCQKEGVTNTPDPSQNDLNGTTWNLLYIDVEGTQTTKVTTEDFGTMKLVAIMDYLTTNNKGTISFGDKNVASDKVTYDVTGQFSVEQYLDDVFINGADSTVNIPIDEEITSEDSYTRVSADSIYCPNGFVLVMDGINDEGAMGAKLRFDGDKLFMTFPNKQLISDTQDGITSEQKNDVSMVIALQKKS